MKFADLIIFENDDFIIINKPSGISSLHERNQEGDSILELARTYTDDPQLCHRLDKETTGALAIAKNPAAYRHLSMQFENRFVKKKYHAVVEGVVPFKEFKIDLPILNDGHETVTIDKRFGKEALTYFTALKLYKHYTLMECMPVTGRLHQIRVHLWSQNARIVADLKYGGKLPYLSSLKKKFKQGKEVEEENPIFKRVALHARSLHFEALKGEKVNVEAPYPKDFQVFIKLLDKYDS